MDDEPDYSEYSFDRLLDAAEHINREEYPKRAARLDGEILRRSRSVDSADASRQSDAANHGLEQKSQIENPSQELTLEFHGSAGEYFRIWRWARSLIQEAARTLNTYE